MSIAHRSEPLVEVHRGDIIESCHHGHVVISDASGEVLEAWGESEAVVLPRSSSKMIQALPLVASGAADRQGLTQRQLAFACASHQGAPIHVEAANTWLTNLELGDDDLICGPQTSRDKDLRNAMIKADQSPCRVHNNCSGKHCGFLTLAKDMGAGPDYVALDHPVQKACREAFEVVTVLESPGYGIDGCSAPNFATTMHGMARAMAFFATAHARNDRLSKAAARLTEALHSHPDMVAGQGRACTLLMRAAREPAALKTGAEGYFIAILPQRGIEVAVKALDGATRAAECMIAAVLVRLGVLDAAHPDVIRFLTPPVLNWDGLVTGQIKPAETLLVM